MNFCSSNSFLSAYCRRVLCFVGRASAEMPPFLWLWGDISSMPRRSATGVACEFLIEGIVDVCVILFYGEPLTVTA